MLLVHWLMFNCLIFVGCLFCLCWLVGCCFVLFCWVFMLLVFVGMVRGMSLFLLIDTCSFAYRLLGFDLSCVFYVL